MTANALPLSPARFSPAPLSPTISQTLLWMLVPKPRVEFPWVFCLFAAACELWGCLMKGFKTIFKLCI